MLSLAAVHSPRPVRPRRVGQRPLYARCAHDVSLPPASCCCLAVMLKGLPYLLG